MYVCRDYYVITLLLLFKFAFQFVILNLYNFHHDFFLLRTERPPNNENTLYSVFIKHLLLD